MLTFYFNWISFCKTLTKPALVLSLSITWKLLHKNKFLIILLYSKSPTTFNNFLRNNNNILVRISAFNTQSTIFNQVSFQLKINLEP